MRSNSIFSGTMLAAAASAAPTTSGGAWNDGLPIVDLGYERHQALAYNEKMGVYNFSNIPFAAPPVGDLRFAAPQPPLNSSGVQNGNFTKICPQAGPGWSELANGFAAAYAVAMVGGNKNASMLFEAANLTGTAGTTPPFEYKPDPYEDEDCLYLDILVPKEIFDQGKMGKAPVLAQIYGGGYTGGAKTAIGGTVGPAEGLLARSNNSFIYVTMNYRLGALGWSAGPSFQAAGGAPNAGLLDQRASLEWIQQYIGLFGGDPAKVALIGESAGGGSIQHQITAYGGNKGPVPFQRAIPQSPGFSPVKSNNYTEQTYLNFLAYTGASDLEELRKLPTETLMKANAEQVWYTNTTGSFTYGPVVDGDFVPGLPGNLLADGLFDQSVQVLAGHNTREGYLFTSPFSQTNEAVKNALRSTLLTASEGVLDYIVEDLYPAEYNGSQPYANWYERASLITTELAFTCNAYYMREATANISYGYTFDIYPAYHGQDVAYTYYYGQPPGNATNPASVQNVNSALTLQDWELNFAINGVPTTTVQGSPNIPLYSDGMEIGVLRGPVPEFSQALEKDPTANPRCQWWQKALYA